jgi:nucleotide-binding universal stress UspA family protein
MIDREPLGNILVATDFSAGGRQAVQRAARLPIARGSALTILHVMPRLQPQVAMRAEAAVRDAIDVLAADARRLLPVGVDLFTVIETGDAWAEIVRRAAGERSQLIVVGRSGRGRRLFGSTADRVLRTTHTPVLVVAADPVAPYGRPLVAVDREGTAVAAISLLTRVVAEHVRGALAVHVLDPHARLLPIEYGLTATEIAEYRDLPEQTVRREIEPGLDALCGTDFDFDLRCVEGGTASTILDMAAAEEADLIALGTHGRSGLRHLLIGSVCESVVRDSSIDVLAARSSGEPGWSAVGPPQPTLHTGA